jgi:hypothetical protein
MFCLWICGKTEDFCVRDKGIHYSQHSKLNEQQHICVNLLVPISHGVQMVSTHAEVCVTAEEHGA